MKLTDFGFEVIEVLMRGKSVWLSDDVVRDDGCNESQSEAATTPL